MTDVLLVVAVLLLVGILVFLVVLAKRRPAGVLEAEGRAAVAAAEAAADEVRRRLADVERQAEDLRGRLAAEHAARVAADTRLDAERRSFDEQRALLDEAEAKLKDAFRALSADALSASRQEFLGQADERLRPIQDLLRTYEQRLQEIEKARSDAYGGLKNHLDALAEAHRTLQKEAHQLSTALRSPTVRGRWGEMTLRRVVEVAGMSPHCDFEEQVTAAGEEGRLRPDMLIRLPGDRLIVVDSKVPLAGYLDAVEARDEPVRQTALGRHAKDVRQHVQALGRKAYWDQFENTPDFVVLFLPGEAFFSAALEQDRSLLEDAMRSKVFLATPTTLMALLGIVAHGWRQQEMAENAERIGATGRELFERVTKFLEHFTKIGDGLQRAAKAYDAAVGSYESRVRPSADRLAQEAAVLDKALPDLGSVEGPVRALPAPAGSAGPPAGQD